MLENLEFSKKYKIFCNDEVQARYILSLSLMERINKLDEFYILDLENDVHTKYIDKPIKSANGAKTNVNDSIQAEDETR